MLASQNPFRRSRIAKIRYQIEQADFNNLIDQVSLSNYCGSIRGPHGTGKSTLLEDVQAALNKQGCRTQYHRIHQGITRAEKRILVNTILHSANDTVFCLDGGENLGPITWAWLGYKIRSSGRRLLATTHRNSFLPTLYRTSIDKSLMLELTCSLADQHWNNQLEQVAVETFQRHRGNMREVFRACYMALALEPNDRFGSNYIY